MRPVICKQKSKREVWFTKYDPFDQQSQKQAFPVRIPDLRKDEDQKMEKVLNFKEKEAKPNQLKDVENSEMKKSTT